MECAWWCPLISPLALQVGHLNVVIPPDIVSDETSGDTMVSEGSSVRLRCQARGYPEPTVIWRREDGRNITLREPGQSKKEGQLHSLLSRFSSFNLCQYPILLIVKEL